MKNRGKIVYRGEKSVAVFERGLERLSDGVPAKIGERGEWRYVYDIRIENQIAGTYLTLENAIENLPAPKRGTA